MHMKKRPSLASVLTPFPYHIDCMSSLQEARGMMREHAIRHLIVMENGDIAGILSERDLQHHAAAYGGKANDSLVVNDICSSQYVVADIHDPLDKVLEMMAERHLGSVIALNKGELAGIFTTTDACKHFAQFIQHNLPQDQPDLTA